MRSGFEVVKASFFTLIQDLGRSKYTHLGVSNSGALDEYSMLWANKLLGNKNKASVLEIAFSNVILKATSNTVISITGAYCEFFINDVKQSTWRSFNIKAGDTLKIGKFISGSRVYLAVKGGFKVKEELGSSSTSIKEGFGGLNGDRLKDNDFLEYQSFSEESTKKTRQDLLPTYENELTLKVVLSYQDESFSKQEQEKFFSNTFTVTQDFNRMACKLDGVSINSSLNGIVSEGICFGAIQIPSDGKPIILLKERQTIGGYPKIGSVLGLDCFKLAQAKIGTKIKFEAISIKQAQEKTKSFYSIFS